MVGYQRGVGRLALAIGFGLAAVCANRAQAAPAAPRDHVVLTDPGERFTATLRTGGVTLEMGSAHRVNFRPSRWGCAGDLQLLPRALPERTSTGDRIDYRRGLVTEWYKRLPNGIEQGFDVAAPPCDDPQRLIFELEVSGLEPSTTNAGHIALRDEAGAARVRVSDLTATDAAGRVLPSEMQVVEGRIELRVDARGARYPLVVDPAFVEEGSFTTFNAGAVAISGDTVAVGDSSGSVGNVHLYVRSGSTWSLQQTLSYSTPYYYDGFGGSVGISGDTLIVGAPSWGPSESGHVDVFVRSGGVWNPEWGTPGSNDFSYLGSAVAVDGDTALVSSMSSGTTVYVRSGSSWSQQQVLAAATALAIDGNTAALAASSGSSIYVRSGTTWTLQQTLPSASSIALKGDTVLVGSLLYERSGTTWTAKPFFGGTGYSVGLGNSVALVDSDVVARGVTGWSTSKSFSLPTTPVSRGLGLNGTTAAIAAGAAGLHIYRLFGLLGGPCMDLPSPTASCWESLKCADGVCCTSTCVGACEACSVAAGGTKDGTCTTFALGTPGTPACAGFVCSGTSGSCPTSCNDDTTCPPGKYCSAAGTCVDKKVKSASCVPASDCKNPSVCSLCQSGLSCADGYCCDSACSGACDVCSQALGASANGTCTILADGATPSPAGACSGLLCAGGSAACPTSCVNNTDCVTNNVCTLGSCVGPKALGAACSGGSECASNFCVDGVCCDSVCNGQCEACDGGGGNLPGSCKAVVGKPHGSRPQCGGSALCVGKCNGADPTSCNFPSLGTPCALASCVGDVVQPEGKCDGAGTCSIPSTSNCAPYSCDTATVACATSCASDAQCAQGSKCNTTTGKCAGSGTTCVDALTVQLPNGQTQSCSPYKCVGGACADSCTVSNDCASGFACQAKSCVAESDAGTGGSAGSDAGGSDAGGASSGGHKADSSDSGGCGCRAGGHRGRPVGAALLLLFGVVAARRRPRRRRIVA